MSKSLTANIDLTVGGQKMPPIPISPDLIEVIETDALDAMNESLAVIWALAEEGWPSPEKDAASWNKYEKAVSDMHTNMLIFKMARRAA